MHHIPVTPTAVNGSSKPTTTMTPSALHSTIAGNPVKSSLQAKRQGDDIKIEEHKGFVSYTLCLCKVDKSNLPTPPSNSEPKTALLVPTKKILVGVMYATQHTTNSL